MSVITQFAVRSTFPEVPPVISPSGLKDAMRHLVGGVCVITAGIGADRTGATVTSAHSLSMEPETMLVSLNLASSSLPMIRQYGHYGVSLLADDQEAVADRFAGRGGVKGADRYLGADWSMLETGASLLDGALAVVDCGVERIIEHHSHALVFGAVRAVRVRSGAALVYSHGRYGRHRTED